MNYEQYARSYKVVSIETASPGKLILMLFDGALRFLDAALDGFEIENDTRRNETVNNNILRAQSIVAELQSCLDLTVEGELPMTLYRLYDFVYDQFQKANLKKSRQPLRVGGDAFQGRNKHPGGSARPDLLMEWEAERFWRLLREYEKLIAEEKLAWRKKDLQYAEDLLEQKEALIKPLGDVARALEISGRSSPEIRIRLRRLQEEQRENLSLINLQVETTKNELKSIESGRVRIQQFKNTYVAAGRSDEPPLSRFKA